MRKDTPAHSAQSASSGSPRIPWLFLLRLLLLVDALVLGVLGSSLLVLPEPLQSAFGFGDLPPSVDYLLGLWGCALVTMAFGYAVAATSPLRHLVWVQVGILRGGLEVIFGLYAWAQGLVEWKQAGLGIVLAGLMSLGYLVLYPRKRRDIRAIPAGS